MVITILCTSDGLLSSKSWQISKGWEVEGLLCTILLNVLYVNVQSLQMKLDPLSSKGHTIGDRQYCESFAKIGLFVVW